MKKLTIIIIVLFSTICYSQTKIVDKKTKFIYQKQAGLYVREEVVQFVNSFETQDPQIVLDASFPYETLNITEAIPEDIQCSFFVNPERILTYPLFAEEEKNVFSTFHNLVLTKGVNSSFIVRFKFIEDGLTIYLVLGKDTLSYRYKKQSEYTTLKKEKSSLSNLDFVENSLLEKYDSLIALTKEIKFIKDKQKRLWMSGNTPYKLQLSEVLKDAEKKTYLSIDLIQNTDFVNRKSFILKFNGDHAELYNYKYNNEKAFIVIGSREYVLK